MAIDHAHPLDGIDLPKLTPKKAPKIVEEDAARKLLDRARETRLYPLILLDLATGASRGELPAFQWADLDFQAGLMNVSKSAATAKKPKSY